MKKPNLDHALCQNYRLISNLSSFLKFSNVLSSSNFFLQLSTLLPFHHYCGFRINHSTETARLYLLSGIYSAINKSQLSAPGPFDVSAAFNMVDPQILRERPESSWKLFLHQEPPFPLALILPIWPNPYHYPATVVHPGFQSIWAFPRTLSESSWKLFFFRTFAVYSLRCWHSNSIPKACTWLLDIFLPVMSRSRPYRSNCPRSFLFPKGPTSCFQNWWSFS